MKLFGSLTSASLLLFTFSANADYKCGLVTDVTADTIYLELADNSTFLLKLAPVVNDQKIEVKNELHQALLVKNIKEWNYCVTWELMRSQTPSDDHYIVYSRPIWLNAPASPVNNLVSAQDIANLPRARTTPKVELKTVGVPVAPEPAVAPSAVPATTNPAPPPVVKKKRKRRPPTQLYPGQVPGMQTESPYGRPPPFAPSRPSYGDPSTRYW
jgi:hypothetical protein